MTAYAAAQVPVILELGNKSISITFKSVSGDGIDRSTLIFNDNVNSHFSQTLITWLGIIWPMAALTHWVLNTHLFLVGILARLIPGSCRLDPFSWQLNPLSCLIINLGFSFPMVEFQAVVWQMLYYCRLPLCRLLLENPLILWSIRFPILIHRWIPLLWIYV